MIDLKKLEQEALARILAERLQDEKDRIAKCYKVVEEGLGNIYLNKQYEHLEFGPGESITVTFKGYRPIQMWKGVPYWMENGKTLSERIIYQYKTFEWPGASETDDLGFALMKSRINPLDKVKQIKRGWINLKRKLMGYD